MLGDCCDDTCTYVREKFNRANETPIASPWEKLLGNTWNLRDKLLDGLNTGTYRYNFAFPGAATDARHASVRFRINSAGTTELLLAIAEDSFLGQPYDWFTAFVEYKSTGCSFLGANSFYHGAGYGALPGPSITNRVQCPSLTLNEWHRLEGCLIPNAGSYGYDGYNLIIAKLTCADGTIYSCQELSNTGQTLGAHGGLKFNRSGSIGSVEFDDYEETYYRNSPSGQHRTCPWCHTGCEISRDDFTTDEPCMWDVRSGSYSVSGGLFTITADGSVIQHHIFHPDLRTTFKFTVDVVDDGIVRRFYQGNGYAVLDTNAGKHRLRLYDNSNTLLDTNSDPAAIATDSHSTLAVVMCYSRGLLSCTVYGATDNGVVSLCVDSSIGETDSGYWASLGGDNGATFDNFVLSKTYNSAAPSDAACDNCMACPAECTDCCDSPDPYGSYLIDLGAGGWTEAQPDNPAGRCDDYCSTCVEIAGEFVLAASDTCRWEYGDSACDSLTNPTNCYDFVECNTLGWSIVLTLVRDGTGCRWKVVVTIGATSKGPPCFIDDYTVTYYSDYLIDDSQCRTMPVTLTKDSGEAGPAGGDICLCTGNLPATITIDAV